MRLTSFLDAIASQEIPYIQVTYLLTHIQSSNNLLGQASRPFRQSKDAKKGNWGEIVVNWSEFVRIWGLKENYFIQQKPNPTQFNQT